MFGKRQILLGFLIVSIFWFMILIIQTGDCGLSNARAMEKEAQIKLLHRQLSIQNKQIEVLKNGVNRTDTVREVKQFPTIFIITPTYARLVQKAELTRIYNTLLNVPHVHWILVEDAADKTPLVSRFVKKCKLPVTHLSASTPKEFKMSNQDPSWLKPRGVLQRNAGLQWLRSNFNSPSEGVVYFADDDNTYDLQLFEEMRYTKKASVWPVGIVGYLRYESPILDQGKVVSWFSYWKVKDRLFATDMAGFAVSLGLVLSHPSASFSLHVERGHQESHLLQGLGLSLSDLEPRAHKCTEVLVWHTRTEVPTVKNEAKMKALHGHGTDLNIEV